MGSHCLPPQEGSTSAKHLSRGNISRIRSVTKPDFVARSNRDSVNETSPKLCRRTSHVESQRNQLRNRRMSSSKLSIRNINPLSSCQRFPFGKRPHQLRNRRLNRQTARTPGRLSATCATTRPYGATTWRNALQVLPRLAIRWIRHPKAGHHAHPS